MSNSAKAVPQSVAGHYRHPEFETVFIRRDLHLKRGVYAVVEKGENRVTFVIANGCGEFLCRDYTRTEYAARATEIQRDMHALLRAFASPPVVSLATWRSARKRRTRTASGGRA